MMGEVLMESGSWPCCDLSLLGYGMAINDFSSSPEQMVSVQ